MSWSNWTENKSLNRSVKFSKSCVNGIREIVSNRAVLLCGTLQALFEAVISIFVFLWVRFPIFLEFCYICTIRLPFWISTVLRLVSFLPHLWLQILPDRE